MPNRTSERLNFKKDKIVKLWMERAKAEIMASHQQTKLALSNSLEGFLGQIAEALAYAPEKTEAQEELDRVELGKFARGHGESRASMKNYTVESLIREYHILRQAICDVLEEEEPLRARDREIITSIIEQAVNDAAVEYTRILREIRERFTATLVHDLRNPISAVILNAQMIQRRPDDAAMCAKNALRILDRLHHVSAMIDDVLDASKLSAGEKLTLPFEECDLAELLARITADFGQHFPGRVHLVLEGDLNGHWNPRALRRIVDNLLTNAEKYGAKQGQITLTGKGQGNKVVIAVHNHGPAISEEDQGHIFQQFQRTKSAGTQAGWGLGLVVVRGLTAAHGGSVKLESSLEAGTKFIITIPRDSREVDDDLPARRVS